MELSVLKSLSLVVRKTRAMVRKCTTKGLYIFIGETPLIKVYTEDEKVNYGYMYKGYTRWKIYYHPTIEFECIFNWLIIASAGDTTRWAADYNIDSKKSGPETAGLAGALHDLVRW